MTRRHIAIPGPGYPGRDDHRLFGRRRRSRRPMRGDAGRRQPAFLCARHDVQSLRGRINHRRAHDPHVAAEIR